MNTKQISKENTKYSFLYEVETSLWKNPFKKTITDELEYAKFRQQNAYHDLKQFVDDDPLTARKLAFNYLRSMIEVMCESIGEAIQQLLAGRPRPTAVAPSRPSLGSSTPMQYPVR